MVIDGTGLSRLFAFAGIRRRGGRSRVNVMAQVLE